jgi:hypothetical protein
MTNDVGNVSVTLDPGQNCFVVRIADHTIAVPPRQFEQLLERALAAAALHIEAHLQSTGKIVKKNEPTEVIRSTGMDAHADLGARNIVTRMHIGPLALNFACPREIVIEYCAEVMSLLQDADAPPSKPMS